MKLFLVALSFFQHFVKNPHLKISGEKPACTNAVLEYKGNPVGIVMKMENYNLRRVIPGNKI